MQVLITGGTGDLGHRVVDRLRVNGHHPIIATRTPSGPDTVAYDLEDPPPLDGYDAVVHLASDAMDPQRDVEAVRRLVEAGEAAGLPHLVFMSIVGIDDHPLPYYRAKVTQEELLAASRVPWTVLRATQFHSFVPRIALMLKRGRFTIVPKGYRIQAIDADRVADRLVELVEAGPSGRARDIGGPEVVDVAEALEAWAAESGKRLRIARVPVPGSLGRAFRDGLNLLDEGGEVLGDPYSAFVVGGL